jgi:hypothetical protein
VNDLKHIYNACDPFVPATEEDYYDCSEARGSGSLTLEFQRHLGLAEDYLSFLFSGHLGSGKSSELRNLERVLEADAPGRPCCFPSMSMRANTSMTTTWPVSIYFLPS